MTKAFCRALLELLEIIDLHFFRMKNATQSCLKTRLAASRNKQRNSKRSTHFKCVSRQEMLHTLQRDNLKFIFSPNAFNWSSTLDIHLDFHLTTHDLRSKEMEKQGKWKHEPWAYFYWITWNMEKILWKVLHQYIFVLLKLVSSWYIFSLSLHVAEAFAMIQKANRWNYSTNIWTVQFNSGKRHN